MSVSARLSSCSSDYLPGGAALRADSTLVARPIELISMGASTVFVAFVIRDGRSRRWEGLLLIAVYIGFALWFFAAGDR